MNKEFMGDNFNDIYGNILEKLVSAPEYISKNRKGETIYELIFPTIILTNPDKCYATMRDMSMTYLVGELIFYLKGYNRLSNIKNYSKFWSKISDDGINLNSCYGYYFYRMPLLQSHNNQLQYCIEQLKISPESKKAVMTIYEASKHSYKTKDNPCTMYMQFFIRNDKLHAITNMRSNDIWYGLPYDVPFFTFVQKQIYLKLLSAYPKLRLGNYIHRSNSLHLYDRNLEEASKYLANPAPDIDIPRVTKLSILNLPSLLQYEKDYIAIHTMDLFLNWCTKILDNHRWLKEAWKISKKSKCLKKKVGGVYTKNNKIISSGWSGRPEEMGKCKECTRKTEVYYQDGCNSIHSEYRGLIDYCKKGYNIHNFKGSSIYLTHGPCDQCMKLLIELGVEKCIFDVYYKTNFKKYEGYITVEDKNGRVLCSK